MIPGGYDDTFQNKSAVVEVYNPTTQIFGQAGNMTYIRAYHTVTLLPDGTVLIAGGDIGPDINYTTNYTELYEGACPSAPTSRRAPSSGKYSYLWLKKRSQRQVTTGAGTIGSPCTVVYNYWAHREITGIANEANGDVRLFLVGLAEFVH